MRKIFLILFVSIFFIQDISSQIDTMSIQGLNCYNDTAFIKLDLSAGFVIVESDEWQYQPYDSVAWQQLDSSSSLNSSFDTLFTTVCGKYRFTVFNTNTGGFPDTLIYFIPCPVTVGLGQLEKIKCYGNSDGILIAPTFGGVVFDPDSSVFDSLGIYSPNDTTGDEYYTYQWFKSSNLLGANLQLIGDSTNVLDNVSAGFYSVEVTDALGCKDTLNFSDTLFTWVNNPYPLMIDSLITNNVSCYGGQDGSVRISANGGRKFHSNRNYFYYLIDSNNDTIFRSDNLVVSSNFSQLSTFSDSSLIVDSISFSSLGMGSYKIVVIDSFGCIIDTVFSIFEPNPYEVFTTELSPLLCIDDSVWFFIDSVTGGQSTQNYYWLESNSMSDSIYVGEGDHNIIVEDTVFGCLDTLSVNCQAEFEIFIEAIITDVDCNGDSTGAILIDSIFGGTSPYDYNWSFSNDSLVTGLIADTYHLQVTDNSVCTQTFKFIISENDNISTNGSIVEPSCNGFSDGSIEVLSYGGQSPYNYNWLNGTGSANLLFGLPIGNYTLVIEDILGCKDTTSFNVTEPDSLDLEFDNFNNTLLCYAGLTSISVLITGGTGPFDILWSNGSILSQTVIGAGFYTCEVTDGNGCFTSNSILITQPDEFFISNYSFTNPLCLEGGSAEIETSGGTLPITYLWSTGETTQSINDLLVNSCWVIATDSCGNTDSLGFSFIPYDLITDVNYNDTTHISQVIVSPLSSGTIFTYEWFNINDTNNIISTDSIVLNLCEGTYIVRTTDQSNGCYVDDTLSVSFVLISSITDVTYNDTTHISQVIVSDLSSGIIFTYEWFDINDLNNIISTDSAVLNLCEGTYIVRTIDQNNICYVIEDTLTVSFYLIDSITDVLYNDTNHLSQVIISPLFSDIIFTYEWYYIYDLGTVLATSSDVINLCEGTYIVRTIDEGNVCYIIEDTLTISFYLLDSIVDLETTTVLPDSNLWGFGPYTYLWGPNSGLATQKANICPGDHWLEVTDKDGCTIDTFFTIESIDLNLDPADDLIECDLENLDIELTVSVTGGTDPYTYLWFNGDTDSSTNLALSPGPLAITVMDNNACTLDTIFTVTAMTEECVPNVFTPNNDLVNDFWNLEKAYIYSDSEIKVFGRFGREVFESLGYENPWDGKNKKGNDVPDGAYFYHIELGHGYAPIKGTVTILR